MQGAPSGVRGSYPGGKRWGLCHGSDSGRDRNRSHSEYILEVEPPGFTFGVWVIENTRR